MASKPQFDDDLTPAEPPPSYSEAINSAPVPPARPDSDNTYLRPGQGPPMPQRPQYVVGQSTSQSTTLSHSVTYSSQNNGQSHSYNGPNYSQSQPPSSNQANNAGQSHNGLYSNNPNLPFEYPRGHLCRKCKNTGYKIKNGKVCHDCWDAFYLRDHAYNPNPNLPFRYPKRFICDKCRNTGVKLRNGLTCQDCYASFAPRNNYLVSLTYSPFGFGYQDIVRPAGYAPNAGPAIRVPPGDPRLGGTLCGNCRGSGQVTFFLDLDLCPVCGGLGRLLNTQPQQMGYR